MMQPQTIDLSGLRDVHLPPVPPLWPLPPRFWIVTAVAICAVAAAVFCVRRIRRMTAKKYANREVERITKQFDGDGYRSAVELSLLMRRIALMKHPRADVAGLTGRRWRQFLENTVKKPVFKGAAGDVAETVMFIPPDRFKNGDAAVFIAAAKEWIAENT